MSEQSKSPNSADESAKSELTDDFFIQECEKAIKQHPGVQGMVLFTTTEEGVMCRTEGTFTPHIYLAMQKVAEDNLDEFMAKMRIANLG